MSSENNPQSSAPNALDNRVFGLIFAAIFVVIGCWPLLFGHGGARLWALVIAVAFTVPALLFPKVLSPLNALWAKFGMLMHKIVNPILMGLIFFVTVLPTGIVMRLLGKDPMQRKFDHDSNSYWIQREPGSLTKASFDEQF